jgi:uncharacterized protein (DUF2267 family)
MIMTITGLKTFDHSPAVTKEWLNGVKEEMELADQQQAYEAMRAVLHTLRDRLTVEEATNFAAQLPMPLQSLYYHEWTPGDKPLKIRDKEGFIGIIAEKLMANIPPEDASRAVFKIFERRITAGQTSDVKNSYFLKFETCGLISRFYQKQYN